MANFYLRNAVKLGLLLAGSGGLQARAQVTYLDPGSPEHHLLDRIETRTGTLSEALNTGVRPVSRKVMVEYLSEFERESRVGRMQASDVDVFNIGRAIGISGEWYENASGESGFVDSRRPVLKHIYKKRSDFINVETDDFFLSVNPVLYLQGGHEMDNGRIITNTRGIALRGRISDRLGFYTMLADNQETVPVYVQDWVDAHRGQLPGNHLAVRNGRNYDVFLARGYIDFAVVKDKVNLTFGYDKHHVGYGIRSLVRSYNAAPATFLRLQGRWKRFYYESLMLEQVPNNFNFFSGGDRTLPRNYAAIHQLNYMPSRWLSVGVFESTVLPESSAAVGAFVPVIGYQSIAKQLSGSAANNAWGLQFKAVPLTDVQVYGQAFFDQLDLGNIGRASWQNKYGFQLGLKYYDVATVKGLDGQVEMNIVRPFTYAAVADSTSSFTHYNLPVAHPLGNNFVEWTGNLQYQPAPLWTLAGRAVYSIRGNTTANNGSSIYDIAALRTNGDLGYPFLMGQRADRFWGNLNLAYELRPNLFLEVGGTLLSDGPQQATRGGRVIGYGALRWNISRTVYDLRQ